MDDNVMRSSLDPRDYPPNNQASREEPKQAPPPPSNVPVARPPEKNPVKRLGHVFFDGDLKESAKYMAKHKLRPALMKAGYDVIAGWLWRSIFGNSSEPPPMSTFSMPERASYENFNGYSRRAKQVVPFSNSLLRYSTEEGADRLISEIIQYVSSGKTLTIADLLEKKGYGSEWNDNSYGWEKDDLLDIRSRKQYCNDGYWYVIMPEPKHL